MSPTPEWQRPIVGYAMWHLLHHQTAQQVREMIADHRDYPQLTTQQLDSIMALAQRQSAATLQLSGQQSTGTLGAAYGLPADYVGEIGVRVQLETVDDAGQHRTSSVVVNVAAGADVQAVRDLVEELALAGDFGLPNGSDRNLQSVVATVIGTWLGGYSNPAVTLAF